jgi:hypothetical protein
VDRGYHQNDILCLRRLFLAANLHKIALQP